jgi:hypothetical protein
VSFYLNSYIPLAASKAGRDASKKYGIPPFVDGSIRREPDFEHRLPGISCLCRADKFAPRLKPGDVVAYMLRKERYGTARAQRRLTAVLRVLEALPTHSAAAEWYTGHGLSLPNNCWVHGNPAKPLEQGHRRNRNKHLPARQYHRQWDVEYRGRAMTHGTFVVCECLFTELSWGAPEITEPQLEAVFGCVPGTRNPGVWSTTHADNLLRLLELDIPLCAR